MRVSKWMLVTLAVALVLVMYFQFSTGHQFEGFAQELMGSAQEYEGFRDGGSRPGGGGSSRPGGGHGGRPGGGHHHGHRGGDYSAYARPGGGWGGSYGYGWWPSYWWPYYDYLWFPSCDLTGCPDGYTCAKDPETGYSYCV